MAICHDCHQHRGLAAARQDDGMPDLVWCCLFCGRIVCRGCIEKYTPVGLERRCQCGYLITGNQRIDNNRHINW